MMAAPTIKTLWGLAKCKELSMTDEELHLLVAAHTGKDSIKLLNKRELGTMVGVLLKMKDPANNRKNKMENGNPATVNQRKKIYKLTQELGWEKEARINGFCKRMFGISAVHFLNYQQCSKLIEALKSMVERTVDKNSRNTGE